MATSPATAPVQAPRTVALPLCSHSIVIQVNAAAAAAVFVLTNAATADVPADSALPALKPNQPNQSSAVPSAVMVRLCGCISSSPSPFRLPMTSTQHSAATPEMRCTTKPAGEVQRPKVDPDPAAGPPDPVGDGIVDEGRPEQGEDEVGRELHPLGERARDQCRGDDREHELEDHEELVRDRRRVIGVGRQAHAPQPRPLQAADEAAEACRGRRPGCSRRDTTGS